MRKNKVRKHPRYYAIPAYQILSRKSDAEMAKALGVSIRKYRDKIEGWSDFSYTDGDILYTILGRRRDDIFLTENVSNRNIKRK